MNMETTTISTISSRRTRRAVAALRLFLLLPC